MFKVLIVDDDAQLRTNLIDALSGKGYSIHEASNGREAVEKVKQERHALVIMDVNMPEMSGIDALKQIKAFDPSIIVLMLTAYSNIADAVSAVKEGAFNYVSKPVRSEDIQEMVERALEAHRLVETIALSAPVIGNESTADGQNGNRTTESFIAKSAPMRSIFSIIHRLAKVDTAVLIRGESGTGKELVARAIHFNSTRKNEKFVPINCAAIPENLIESELFGHEKGAFTGADQRKIGKFQYAEGGTLFLDEIGDISPAMQVKLLRVLQERKFSPVGSNREINSNVRVIAATNRNLEEMIKARQFREDLFYRLNVLPIFLPPLRDRKEDIEALVNYFIKKFNRVHSRELTTITRSALEALKRHTWPGNIRELENVIEHAFVMENDSVVSLAALPQQISGLMSSSDTTTASQLSSEINDDQDDSLDAPEIDDAGETDADEIAFTPGSGPGCREWDFQVQKEEFERNFILKALKANDGRINRTARNVNIPKKTLLRKIEKYGLNPREFFIQKPQPLTH